MLVYRKCTHSVAWDVCLAGLNLCSPRYSCAQSHRIYNPSRYLKCIQNPDFYFDFSLSKEAEQISVNWYLETHRCEFCVNFYFVQGFCLRNSLWAVYDLYYYPVTVNVHKECTSLLRVSKVYNFIVYISVVGAAH